MSSTSLEPNDGSPSGTAHTADLQREDFLYDIFISYRWLDGRKPASWLSRQLRAYRAPRRFNRVILPLRIYLDIERERVTPAIWEQRIRPALERSRFLLVVLTPSINDLQPDGGVNWAMREIEAFLQLAQGQNLILARAGHSTDVLIPPNISSGRPDPGWVDIRQAASWLNRIFRRASLNDKVTALAVPTLDINEDEIPTFNRLAEREKHRLAWLIAGISSALLLLFVTLTIALAVQFLTATRAQRRAFSRQLVAEAAPLLQTRLDLALLLDVTAIRSENSFVSRAALLRAVEHNANLIGSIHAEQEDLDHIIFGPPTANFIVSGGSHDIRFWEQNSLRQLGAPLVPHGKSVFAFDISHDGTMLVSGGCDDIAVVGWCKDGQVRLWGVQTRSQLGPPLGRQLGFVMAVAFSPDDRIIASAFCTSMKAFTCPEVRLRFWDTKTQEEIQPQIAAHKSGPVNGLAIIKFSPDGRTLLTRWCAQYTERLCERDEVDFWDVDKHTQSAPPLLAHNSQITALAINNTGSTLATAGCETKSHKDLDCHEYAIRLWDVHQRRLLHLIDTSEDTVRSLAFSNDGDTLIVGKDTGVIEEWNFRAERMERLLSGHADAVRSIGYSASNNLIASASSDGVILIWNLVAHPRLFSYLSEKGLGQLTFNNDHSSFAAVRNKDIFLFDGRTRKPVGLPFRTRAESITGMAFSPDGRTLATGTSDMGLITWNIATRLTSNIVKTNAFVGDVAFSPKGTEIAYSCTSEDALHSSLHVRSLGGTSILLSPIDLPGQTVFAFSPDGNTISATSDNNIVAWSLSTGRPIGLPMTGHTNRINEIAFSPDGKVLASASSDESVRLWNVATHAVLETFRFNSVANSVSFSSDGNTLAGGLMGGELFLLDVPSKQLVLISAATGEVIDKSLTANYDGGTSVGSVLFDRNNNSLMFEAREPVFLDLSLSHWQRLACDLANRTLTPDEQRQYLEADVRTTDGCAQFASGGVR